MSAARKVTPPYPHPRKWCKGRRPWAVTLTSGALVETHTFGLSKAEARALYDKAVAAGFESV